MEKKEEEDKGPKGMDASLKGDYDEGITLEEIRRIRGNTRSLFRTTLSD